MHKQFMQCRCSHFKLSWITNLIWNTLMSKSKHIAKWARVIKISWAFLANKCETIKRKLILKRYIRNILFRFDSQILALDHVIIKQVFCLNQCWDGIQNLERLDDLIKLSMEWENLKKANYISCGIHSVHVS